MRTLRGFTDVVIAVGSKNRAKLEAAEMVCGRFFKDSGFKVVGVEVSSGVASQPMTDSESMRGATNRAKAALAACQGASFGIGMEGGVNPVTDGDGKTVWFECGMFCVVDKDGKVGVGSSARFQLSDKIVDRLKAGEELATVIDDMTSLTDVRSGQGAMGIVTDSLLGRAEAYSHGLLFAFAPWLSPEEFTCG